MTALRPMTETEYTAWAAETVPAFAQDKVASGQWTAEEALERSAREYRELLPQGLQSADNFLYTIVDEDGQAVGMLWFAVQTRSGRRIAYVYDVAVRPGRQRQGHAQRALRALEAQALQLGLTGIALHVFGHNRGAQALYARLGFEPTNIQLFKPLA